MRKIARKMKNVLAAKNLERTGKAILLASVALYTGSYFMSKRIFTLYENQKSAIVQDRNSTEIFIQPNVKGHYMRHTESLTGEISRLLTAKEDRFFFYHPGINPVSIARSLARYPFSRRLEGSSTLTQQLVKTLIGNENKRTMSNKIIESFYALSLGIHTSKPEILKMYANTAYFGNRAEGIVEASKTYFNAPPESLNTVQILQLIATLSNPDDYPGTLKNKRKTIALANQLKIPVDEKTIDAHETDEDKYIYRRKNINVFELEPFEPRCEKPCSLTIDQSLTNTVREILRTNLDSPSFASVNNGAVVVIQAGKEMKENELLAIVGSPHPLSSEKGHQINMAVHPRPIGSTAKPFIFAKAFEKGARPYTQVDDIEYKYDIGTGFAFYPKNYDGQYRGTVSLHQALSNSLNVPAVRVLQYAGLGAFYDFLKSDLSFEPLQPLETYELSIALGGLEMDLLTLANYFTLFPNEGTLKPLKLSEDDTIKFSMAKPYDNHQVIDPAYIQLVTKILSDRETSIDQFGLKSNLNLPATQYAVKTGTSYDYHDSWAIGYTPDFLVGVWLGNSDNKPMYRLSGSIGAGKIWHEVMETMLNSTYNKETAFNFDRIKEYAKSGNIEYGLDGDEYDSARDLLKLNYLILQPHDFDTLQYTAGIKVPLLSNEDVLWYINNSPAGQGIRETWEPKKPGVYTISARNPRGKMEKIKVIIKEQDE